MGVQLDIEGPAFEQGWPFGDLVPNHYAAICADPPWRFRTWGPGGEGKSASQHYDVMDLPQIKALPVADLAAKDCVLFLWAISSMLPQALDVMDSWGFTFKTLGFGWAKLTRRSTPSWVPRWHIGTGYWTRANIELCLLGTRGRPQRLDKGVRELIVAPVREHSRKPDEVYDEIVRLVPGPYLELFARTERKGWSCWGNDVGRFESGDAT